MAVLGAGTSGGLRVVAISDATAPEEVDEGGNNFWGVAPALDENDDRIILASDRDFGLFIFRYKGESPRPVAEPWHCRSEHPRYEPAPTRGPVPSSDTTARYYMSVQ